MYNAEGYATGSASPPPSHSEAVGTGAEYRVPIVFCEDEETVMGHSGALPYANTAVVQHAGQQKPVQNLYLAPVQTTEHPKPNCSVRLCCITSLCMSGSRQRQLLQRLAWACLVSVPGMLCLQPRPWLLLCAM